MAIPRPLEGAKNDRASVGDHRWLHEAQVAGFLGLFDDVASHLRECTGLTFSPSICALITCAPDYLNETRRDQRFVLRQALLSKCGRSILQLIRAYDAIASGHAKTQGDVAHRAHNTELVLGQLATKFSIEPLLRLGRGLTSAPRPSVHDATARVLGAIWIFGRVSAAAKFVQAMDVKSPAADFKSDLQEVTQARFGCTPSYVVVDERGPQHSREFVVEVRVRQFQARGTGSSRKRAEQAAAGQVLKALGAPISRINPTSPSGEAPWVHHVEPAEHKELPRALTALLDHSIRNRKLFSMALIHPSYANEHRVSGPARVHNYLLLASLGTRAIDALVWRWLADQEKYPEGFDHRSAILAFNSVRQAARVAALSREHDLPALVCVGRGARTADTRQTESVATDVLHSLLGALVVDIDLDIDALLLRRPVLVDKVFQQVRSACDRERLALLREIDPKSLFQEMFQTVGLSLHENITTHGAPHSSIYRADWHVRCGESALKLGGTAPTKADAQRAAAAAGVDFFWALHRPDLGVQLNQEHGRFLSCFLNRIKEGLNGDRLLVWKRMQAVGLFGLDEIQRAPIRTVFSLTTSRRNLTRIGISEAEANVLSLAIEALPTPFASRLVVSTSSYALELAERLSLTCIDEEEIFPEGSHSFRQLVLVTTLLGRIRGEAILPESLGHVLRELSRTSDFLGLPPLETIADNTVRATRYMAHHGMLLELLGCILREGTYRSAPPVRLKATLGVGVLQLTINCVGLGRSEVLTHRLVTAAIECGLAAELQHLSDDEVQVSLFALLPAELEGDDVDRWDAGLLGKLLVPPAAHGIQWIGKALHDVKNDIVAARRQQRLATSDASNRFRHLGEAEALIRRAVVRLKAAALLVSPYREPDFGPVDIHRLVSGFVSAMAAKLPPTVSLQTHLDSSSIIIEADGDLLRLALENLAKNALEAMAEKGLLSVEWIHDAASAVVLIEVRDTGPGIPDSVLKSLDSGHPVTSKRATGSGLGLHAVRHVARRHGGHVDIKTGSRGTAVTITLPVRRDPPIDNLMTATPSEVAGAYAP